MFIRKRLFEFGRNWTATDKAWEESDSERKRGSYMGTTRFVIG